MLVDFGWLIGSYLFGIMLGCLTGLIPGFHVNNVALIALSLSPVAVAVGIPLDAVAGIIVACGTVHTFLNYIPSALIGAPDDNMALALLPARAAAERSGPLLPLARRRHPHRQPHRRLHHHQRRCRGRRRATFG